MNTTLQQIFVTSVFLSVFLLTPTPLDPASSTSGSKLIPVQALNPDSSTCVWCERALAEPELNCNCSDECHQKTRDRKTEDCEKTDIPARPNT
jgi:hypothetical protein